VHFSKENERTKKEKKKKQEGYIYIYIYIYMEKRINSHLADSSVWLLQKKKNHLRYLVNI
jgi:hypothetical protein